MIFRLNSAEDLVSAILTEIKKNGGYCPCQISKDDGSKCGFNSDNLPEECELEDLCLNGQEQNKCCCNLYQRVEE